MEHREIRSKILYALYNKHYSDQLGHYQQTDKIIEDSGLSHGDIVYLENNGLIKGQSALGHAYPPWIIIISRGIDAVDNFMKNIDSVQSTQPKMKEQIKDISRNKSISDRIRIVFNYLERVQLLFLLANEIAKISSGRL